ncbi:hypothetical protein DRJ22_04455 [Candidatus Woesearchaeota archaeon]|nr:MAG: hypothetical protein DRJ22_04455 [Candidatus Woesearchaeota archaeon]
MEINFSKSEIKFEKGLNSLDKFVIDFTSILNRLNIKYVLVSGYVSILFGRNRSSEDIDMFIERLDFKRFQLLWNELNNVFECIITTDVNEAYNEYLTKDYALRFSKKSRFIPNIEIKFPKIDLDKWALDNRKRVVFNNHTVFISSLELQISFKLYLGSEKDIEDARFLYNLFKENLDMPLLKEFNQKLKIGEVFDNYLR